MDCSYHAWARRLDWLVCPLLDMGAGGGARGEEEQKERRVGRRGLRGLLLIILNTLPRVFEALSVY